MDGFSLFAMGKDRVQHSVIEDAIQGGIGDQWSEQPASGDYAHVEEGNGDDSSDEDIESGEDGSRIQWTHALIADALDVVMNDREVAAAINAPTLPAKRQG